MKKTAIKLLQELRFFLLVWCLFFVGIFSICYLQKEKIYILITKPVTQALKQQLSDIFIYTSIFESFSTDIIICAYSSLFLSLPILVFCIYKFIAKSLFSYEKLIIRKLLLVAVILTFTSICITYYVLFPHIIDFFLNIQNDFAKPMLKISDYVSTFFHIITGIAIIFQFPLVIIGLAKFGLIKSSFLSKNRRTAIVAIFIVATIVTPPDVLSQIICAGLLIVLYELTNLYVKKINKNTKKNKKQDKTTNNKKNTKNRKKQIKKVKN